jgi:hypothetical protein
VYAAYPAARTALALFKLAYGSVNMLFSGFFFFYESYPANPFIAGQGS